MKTLEFATNIKCGGCVAQVAPVLNNEPGIASWHVATGHPQKLLTVITDAHEAEAVKALVEKAGFHASAL